MKPMTLEEAAKYCLENPDKLSREELLNRFPAYRDDLEPLLALDSRLATSFQHTLSDSRRAAMKRQLLAAAQQSPAPVQAVKPATVVVRPAPRPAWLPRFAWGALALLLVLALVWWGSAGSLADNPLYGLKLTSENVLLGFNGAPPAQARGHIDLANSRLVDLRRMDAAGSLGQATAAFDNYDYHLREASTIRGTLQGGERTELDRTIYVSGRAGSITFESLRSKAAALPGAIQQRIASTLEQLTDLVSSSGADLELAGIDPQELLAAADQDIAPLLTPIAGNVLPTATATSIPTPAATATPLCPDRYEDDGIAAAASSIAPDQTQQHAFCDRGDADWVVFRAEAGQGYLLETLDLAPGVDTYVFLFASDGKTVLAENDNGPNGAASEVVFYPEDAGLYYLQIKNQRDNASLSLTYSVRLTLINP